MTDSTPPAMKIRRKRKRQAAATAMVANARCSCGVSIAACWSTIVRPIPVLTGNDTSALWLPAGVPQRNAGSDGDHPYEDAVASHEMMIERGSNMNRGKCRNGGTHHLVNKKKLLREGAVLRPYRRQLEQAEHCDGRPVSGGGYPADERLHDQQRVKRPVGRVRGLLLCRRDIVRQRRRWMANAIAEPRDDDRNEQRADRAVQVVE